MPTAYMPALRCLIQTQSCTSYSPACKQLAFDSLAGAASDKVAGRGMSRGGKGAWFCWRFPSDLAEVACKALVLSLLTERDPQLRGLLT